MSYKKIEEVIALTHKLKDHNRYCVGIDHDSLIVDKERQLFYWNSRSISGNVIDWVIKILGYPDKESAISYLNSIEVSDHVFSDEPVKTFSKINQSLGVFYHRNLDEYSRKWWNNRGVYDLEKWGVGFCKDFIGLGPTSTIPYYEKGELVQLKHRLHEKKDKLRYISEQEGLGVWVYNIDNLNKDRTIIVEGEIKAMVVEEILDIPAIGIPSVNVLPDRYIEKINMCKNIIIALDPDINTKNISWLRKIKKYKEINSLPDKIDDLLVSSTQWKRKLLKIINSL